MIFPDYVTVPFAHGLIQSKIWLCDELEKMSLIKHFDNIYILGAWTGVMGLMIHIRQKITFAKMILVDLNQHHIDHSLAICNSIACEGKLQVQCQDCNLIEYTDGQNLIINTSIDNIVRDDWFNKIPDGSMMALQTRTGGHHDCVNENTNIIEFDEQYPMNTLYLDSKYFPYSDISYTRYMKIGIKRS
jgi:hypothetical protein